MNDHRFTHWPIYERIGEKIPGGMKIQGIILYYESLKTWQCDLNPLDCLKRIAILLLRGRSS